MNRPTFVETASQASTLADHLLDPGRERPCVLVTIAAGQRDPYIHAGDIAQVVAGLAEVYVVPTGSVTFALSDRLPPLTQVYGGAGRVYPVDTRWQADPYSAPLRLAYDIEHGKRAADLLVADALGAANAAGLTRPTRATPGTVRQSGEVRQLVEPSRALIQTDDGQIATVWSDLVLPGIPLTRLFQIGMRLTGTLETEQGRLDVRAAVRSPGDALRHYGEGAVVLGTVRELDDVTATLELYPAVRVPVSAKDVTGNPMDRLTSLMSLDEVIAARIVQRGRPDGPGWRLSMLDLDDDEEPLAAPSLLDGGPPWLLTPAGEVGASGQHPAPAPVPKDRPAHPAPEPAVAGSPTSPPAHQPPPAHAVAELAAMARERDQYRQQAQQGYDDLVRVRKSEASLRRQTRDAKQKTQKLEKQLRELRTGAEGSGVPLFLDPAEQFRFEVTQAWARRIPGADKANRPLRSFTIGDSFLASLDAVEGVDRAKVVDVTVEILTGLVTGVNGRDLHQLRQREGGGAPVVTRADGAVCWRVALQVRSPSARRLHYWQSGAMIELSAVRLHDDMTP